MFHQGCSQRLRAICNQTRTRQSKGLDNPHARCAKHFLLFLIIGQTGLLFNRQTTLKCFYLIKCVIKIENKLLAKIVVNKTTNDFENCFTEFRKNKQTAFKNSI